MTHVEKWAINKHPLIVFFALQLSMVARIRCEALQHIKERRVYGYQFPLPDFPSWFALYQSPTKVLLAYKNFIMTLASDADKESIALFLGFRHVNKSIKRNPEKPITLDLSPEGIKSAMEYAVHLSANAITEVKEEAAATPPDPALKKAFLEVMAKDELTLGYYFLVYIPCLIYYEQSPAELYRKALKRNVAALEKLLKVDPLLLHDPAIGMQIQTLRMKGKLNDYEKLLDAVKKFPSKTYNDISESRKSVKSEYGALIASFALAAKRPLKTPEIRGLYDALARDLEDTLDDTDIKSPSGFDKTVKTKTLATQKKYQKSETEK